MKLFVIFLFLIPQWGFAEDLLSVLNDEKQEKKVEVPSHRTFRALVPRRSAEQNIFFSFLAKGEYQKAMYQWVSAFERHSFRKTSNGKALYGYLLYRNGLQVLGLETLFQAKPHKVHRNLISQWRDIMSAEDSLWAYTNVRWHSGWTKVFGIPAEVMVTARRFDSNLRTKQLDSLLRRTSKGTWERAWTQWQLVNSLVFSGKDIKGAKLLRHLQKAENNPVSEELMNLTVARILYQNGFLNEAIKYYGKIGKKSDYWFEAQEEMAWSYIRLGQPQNSLAITQTLLVDGFEADVGPESFYLASLSDLKVCDYAKVAEVLKNFRLRFQKKTKALLSLKKEPHSAATKKLISLLEKSRTQTLHLGRHGKDLPRYSTRDEYLFYLVQRSKRLSQESKRASVLYSQSLSEGTALVGFQAAMELFNKRVAKRARISESAVLSRIQTLAKEEISEIHRVLKRMQIVEAEVLQQLAMADRVIRDSSKKLKTQKGTTGSVGKDTVSYPFEGEVWFDELSNYKVDIAKGCQAVNTKSL